MVLIELDAASGYTIEGEELNSLPSKVKDLQRVELRRGDTQAAIYFNSVCP